MADSKKASTSSEERSHLKPVPPKTLRFIPVGGLGEIGMNMAILEYEGKILVVDCGQTLPDATMPGVDVVIPDVSYLERRKKDIAGIVITHGHEDHIGALPYVLPKLEGVDVWAPRFASRQIEAKLSEVKPKPKNRVHVANDNRGEKIGPFEVFWIPVTHSTPDCKALGIKTPIGNVIWSGDFKIDPNGLGDSQFDFQTFARWGSEGVLALFCDSTNANVPGVSGNEVDLIGALDQVFVDAGEGSIFFSTFSSSIHRMQTVFDLCVEHDRKVFVAGRSLVRNTEIARSLGVLDAPSDLLVDAAAFAKLPPTRRLALASGCQGETMAAMNRMSVGEHPKLRVNPKDTVVLSARIIPGNERAIFHMVNHFYRRGAKVLTSQDAKIHVSGHGYRQEIKQMIALTRPKHLVPIHGEHRHLFAMRDIGREMKIPEKRIHLLERGTVLDLSSKGSELSGHLEIGRVLVDGRDLDGLDDIVLRDRQLLAEDGMLAVIVAIEADTGEIALGPEIASRGFIHEGSGQEVLDELKRLTLDVVQALEPEAREESEMVRDAIRRALRKHLAKHYDRHPLIVPTVFDM